jgi:hypothetical protein
MKVIKISAVVVASLLVGFACGIAGAAYAQLLSEQENERN